MNVPVFVSDFFSNFSTKVYITTFFQLYIYKKMLSGGISNNYTLIILPCYDTFLGTVPTKYTIQILTTLDFYVLFPCL